ncbi:MFS transporter [Rhodococcus sp. NPDC055112]
MLDSPQPPLLERDRDRFSGREWAMLLVLCGAIFLEGVDVSMFGVALPSIRADLSMSTAELQWVISAYVLGYGGFMLLGGRAADLLGRRRMFLLWLAVFIAFSGLGGLASEGWVLIAARFVTGVAAGFMAPAGLSIITTTIAEGRKRNQALLVYAGTGAAGFSLGLVVGGVLAEFSWRWVFFAPVILAALILFAGVRLIPAQARPAARSMRDFDLVGAFSVTGAMLLLVYGVVRAPDVPLGATVAALAGSAALLALFVAAERQVPTPLVRLGILRSGPLVRANLGAILFAGSFVGFQFILVLYLQELRGWSALATGLAMLAVAGDAVLAPTLTPWLVNRFGNVRVIFAGLLVAGVAYVSFLWIGADTAYAVMLPALILIGVAFALVYGPLTIAGTDGIAEDEQGLAGALLYTSWQLGSALGLAVVTAVQVTTLGADHSEAGLLDSYRAALTVPVLAIAAAAVITAFGLRARAQVRPAERVPVAA